MSEGHKRGQKSGHGRVILLLRIIKQFIYFKFWVFLPLSFEFYLIFLRDIVTVVTVYRPAGNQSPKAVHLGQGLVKSRL